MKKLIFNFKKAKGFVQFNSRMPFMNQNCDKEVSVHVKYVKTKMR